MNANYHTHCTYCDGKDPLSAYIPVAEKMNFRQLGFSSHAPVPFENNFGIPEAQIPNYCQDIDHLKGQTNVQLLKALECDFIPGMSTPFRHFKDTYGLDYIIGGVHLVRPKNSDRLWFIDGHDRDIYDHGLHQLFNGNIQLAVTTFWEQTFEMLETQQLDIIAHVDKIKMHNQRRFFREDESWYEALVDEALRLIRRRGVVMEVNTRGLYKRRCDAFYPSTEILMKAKKLDIPVVVSTDAHKAEELGLLAAEAEQELRNCGYGNVVHFDKREGGFR